MNSKKKRKKLLLDKPIRISIYAFLILILLLSVSLTITAYNSPTETTEPAILYTYGTSTNYNYEAHLNNNTIYQTETLSAGQGALFKKIINHINGSITTTFTINETADITLSYFVKAIVQTDLWEKTYTLIPMTTKTTTGKSLQTVQEFPIDYTFYDALISQINEEIGINAPNPQLLIETPITLKATVANKQITQSLTPQLTMTLTQKTIEFSEILTEQLSGSEVTIKEIYHPEVLEQRANYTYMSILMIFILIVFSFITDQKKETITALEKELKSIQKKYGDWLVETDTNPIDPLSKLITITSIDQLSRISEDFGKPMIHYQKIPDNHMFVIIDDQHIYQFKLLEENIKEIKGFLSFSKKDKILKGECPNCLGIMEYTKEPCPHCGTILTLYEEDDDSSEKQIKADKKKKSKMKVKFKKS